MYVAANNGFSIWAVDPNYTAQTGEVLFTDYPTTAQLTAAFNGYATQVSQNVIKAQIDALEAKQTLRRIREAQAGTDGGWLANLNTQIAALRAQL